MLPAFLGDLVDLLAAFFGNSASEPHVFEHGQCRIHRPWAGGVRASEPALQLLDDVVAMAGLLIEKPEDDVLEIALLEQASGSAAPVGASARRTTAPVPES